MNLPANLSAFLLNALMALTVAACASTGAQQPTAANDPPNPPPLSAPLPLDAGVNMGKLENGLTYYVERNAHPQNRAVLRLVVKAGSVLEDDDQLGLAHFLEHMAFNGTTRYPGNALIGFLESLGVRFGAHVNAFTGYDQTLYTLLVPSDDRVVLNEALLVLAEWAQGISFDPEEIEKERGVVLEEWRRSRGAGGRARDRLLPLTFHGSRYTVRAPIGTEESLRTFDPAALRRFYRDWYRPDLMAVIAVGDFDAAAVTASIRERFAHLKAPSPARPRPAVPIPDHDEPLIGIITDPEIPRTTVSVMFKTDAVEGQTHHAYRDYLVENLAILMLNERFSDLARRGDAPFLGAAIGKQRLTPTEAAYTVGAAVKEGKSVEALSVMLTEIERARRFGFNRAELDRAIAEQKTMIQTYYRERTKTPSSVHADEIVRNFTTGEPMPGIPYEFELSKRFLPELNVEEVNAFARTFVNETNRVVAVVMPEKKGLVAPRQDELVAAMASVAVADIVPLAETRAGGPLLDVLPSPLPDAIVSEQTFDAIGAIDWRLKNGVRIVLKPTDFKSDILHFHAFRSGGHSRAKDEDFAAALTAPALVSRSGLGEFDAGQLNKAVAGAKVQVYPYIGELEEGLRGRSSPDDLELVFQLLYLTFTAPRFDAAAFEVEKEGRRQSILNRLASPEALFSDAYRRLLWQDHPRYRPWTEETLAQMDAGRSERFYRQRFANAAGFTFVFVGAFTPQQLQPLVTQYLATLPAEGKAPPTFVDHGARRASGNVAAVVERGIEPRAQVALTFHGPFADSPENRHRLHTMVDIITA